MTESLILVDWSAQTATAADLCRQLIDEALAAGALIGAVRNADENAAAVEAQTKLRTVKKSITDAHAAASRPLIDTKRRLDTLKASLLEEIEQEDGRIGQLAAGFALAERRRVAAEAALAKEAFEKAEAEKLKALAAEPDPVKQAQILEDHSRKAAMELPLAPTPARAPNQIVREDWDIAVVDLIQFARWALMSGRIDCMDISVRKSAVKELLKGGMTEIPGLKCAPTAKAGVSLGREKKAIEV